MSVQPNNIRRAFVWNHDEIVKLLTADTLITSIQQRIDEIVRCLIHIPPVIVLCPTLLEYKSTFRQIDPKEELPLPEEVLTLEMILTDIQNGGATLDHFKELGELFKQLEAEVPANDLRMLLGRIQFIIRWLEFAKNPENKRHLLDPANHQVLYGLDELPNEVSDHALEEVIKHMVKRHDEMWTALMKAGQELKTHPTFLTPVDKILFHASTYFLLMVNTNFPLDILAEIERKSKELIIRPLKDREQMSKKIQKSLDRERIAESFLAPTQAGKAFSAAQMIVNDDLFKKLSPAVKMKAWRTLAEMDPRFGPFFKRVMWEHVHSLSKREEASPCAVQ